MRNIPSFRLQSFKVHIDHDLPRGHGSTERDHRRGFVPRSGFDSRKRGLTGAAMRDDDNAIAHDDIVTFISRIRSIPI